MGDEMAISNLPIEYKDLSSEDGPKRQYVIPEDIPDHNPASKPLRMGAAYTSDDDDDNAEGIWKRKSMLARERRKSWLKTKTQSQVQSNTTHGTTNRRFIPKAGFSPSSSSVPGSSAPSGDSSPSSSDD